MLRLVPQPLTENWWNAYSKNSAPSVVLAALSQRGARGDSVMAKILGDEECAQAGSKILTVFEDYLHRGMSDSLLAAMSLTNETGANVLHAMNHSCDTVMFMRWINFLVTMLDVDVTQRSKNREAIYHLLNQKVLCDGNTDSKFILLDVIPAQHSESIRAYASLVNKLAQYGLAPDKLNVLKGSNSISREKFESAGSLKSVIHHLKEAVFGVTPSRSHLLKFHLHAKPCVIPHCLDSKEIPVIPMNP